MDIESREGSHFAEIENAAEFAEQVEIIGADQTRHAISLSERPVTTFYNQLLRKRKEVADRDEAALASLIYSFKSRHREKKDSNQSIIFLTGPQVKSAYDFILSYIPTTIDAPPPYNGQKMNNPIYAASRTLVNLMVRNFYSSPVVEVPEARTKPGRLNNVRENVSRVFKRR